MGGGASGVISFSFFMLGWSDDDWLMNIENLQSCIKFLLCQRDLGGNVSIWRAIPTPPDSQGARSMKAANIKRCSKYLELIDEGKSDRLDNIS